MIILTIGEASRRLTDPAAIEENWVTHHLRLATIDGGSPGVHVRIASPGIDLNLSAGDAAEGAAIERRLRPQESRVIDLWQQRGLDREDYRSGQLVSFLHQICDVLENGTAALRREPVTTRTAETGLHRSSVGV